VSRSESEPAEREPTPNEKQRQPHREHGGHLRRRRRRRQDGQDVRRHAPLCQYRRPARRRARGRPPGDVHAERRDGDERANRRPLVVLAPRSWPTRRSRRSTRTVSTCSKHTAIAPRRTLASTTASPGSTRVVEDELVEAELFREFLDGFQDDHPRVRRLLPRALGQERPPRRRHRVRVEGRLPTAEGWYRDGESFVDGDFEAFKALFDEVNEPRNGGSKQSILRSKLNGYGRNRTSCQTRRTKEHYGATEPNSKRPTRPLAVPSTKTARI